MSHRSSPSGSTTRRRRSQGQTLIEFALVLPLFLLMLFGLIDVGRFVYLNSVMSQAAREGARVAAVEASWLGSVDPACGTAGGPVCPANLAALKADITAAANRMIAPFGSVGAVYLSCDTPGGAPTGRWTGASCTNTTAGTDLVSVRITLTSTAITPVVAQLVGSVTAAGSATMVIN